MEGARFKRARGQAQSGTDWERATSASRSQRSWYLQCWSMAPWLTGPAGQLHSIGCSRDPWQRQWRPRGLHLHLHGWWKVPGANTRSGTSADWDTWGGATAAVRTQHTRREGWQLVLRVAGGPREAGTRHAGRGWA